MSRATNRTSNISVTWNFKNPNISRNELINFIHLFREVSGYSREVSGYPREVPGYPRVLSRHCLAISAVSRYLYCLAVFVRRHISTFIFHLSSFHRTRARKFPERLFSPSQRPPESFPTLSPEISRFPFGTKVIKILDLSLYLPPTSYPPPTRPFTLSPTLPYSPKPVLPISKASLSPTTPPDRIRSSRSSIALHVYPHLTLSYNNTHQSSSSLPTITKFAFPTVHPALLSFLFPKASPSPTTPPDRIHSSRSSISLHVLSSSHPVLQQHSSVQFITSYNYQVRFPDRPIRIVILQTGNSKLATHGIARNLKRSAPM